MAKGILGLTACILSSLTNFHICDVLNIVRKIFRVIMTSDLMDINKNYNVENCRG